MNEVKRVTVRLDAATHERLSQYAETHGMAVVEVVRLAILNQLDREPRGKTREGVRKTIGNPDIGQHASKGGKAAAAVRWGDPS